MTLNELKKERNRLLQCRSDEKYASECTIHAEYKPKLDAIESQINRLSNDNRGGHAKNIKKIKHLMR